MSYEIPTGPATEEHLLQAWRFCSTEGEYPSEFVSLEEKPLSPTEQEFVDYFLAEENRVETIDLTRS